MAVAVAMATVNHLQPMVLRHRWARATYETGHGLACSVCMERQVWISG